MEDVNKQAISEKQISCASSSVLGIRRLAILVIRISL